MFCSMPIDTCVMYQSKNNLLMVAGDFVRAFLKNSPVTGVFFDRRLNQQLSKQWKAGDLRRHRAHYDVTVMRCDSMSTLCIYSRRCYYSRFLFCLFHWSTTICVLIFCLLFIKFSKCMVNVLHFPLLLNHVWLSALSVCLESMGGRSYQNKDLPSDVSHNWNCKSRSNKKSLPNRHCPTSRTNYRFVNIIRSELQQLGPGMALISQFHASWKCVSTQFCTHDDVIKNLLRHTGYMCGEFTGSRWIPRTKASEAELWCFFDLRLNKRLSK